MVRRARPDVADERMPQPRTTWSLPISANDVSEPTRCGESLARRPAFITVDRMIARRSAVLLATVALVTALAACAPAAAPKPSPTPTGFASKEEAFAAAEKTYRAYVDALNEVDLSDPATFEPVYAHLRGEAGDASRKSFSQMHADGWDVTGDSVVRLVEPISSSGDEVELAVCVDVSAVKVLNADGKSVVGSRPDVQSLLVRAVPDPRSSSTSLITQFSSRTGSPEC